MGNIFVIIAFVAYALVILGIGIFSYKKSKSMNDYFIGGRQLGSWTTAISAQASDMSGWLLMGLPGAIFVSGLTEMDRDRSFHRYIPQLEDTRGKAP